jgi:hypothetical protein
MVTNPAVKLSTDQVKVSRNGSSFALTDRLCMLTSQPGFDPIRIFLFSKLLQVSNQALPFTGGFAAAIGILDVR